MEQDFSTFPPNSSRVARLTVLIAKRLARRVAGAGKPTRRGGTWISGESMRANLMKGEIIELRRRGPGAAEGAPGLLCDVSAHGPYSRFLLQFLYALQNVFGRGGDFHVRHALTRVSDLLPRTVLQGRSDAHEVRDWSAARDRRGRYGTSPGVGTPGGPEDYRAHLSDGGHGRAPTFSPRRCSRSASRRAVLWLNPLLGNPSYEPLTRGMAPPCLCDPLRRRHNCRASASSRRT